MRKRKRYSVKINQKTSVIVCRYCKVFPYLDDRDEAPFIEFCAKCSTETEEEREQAARQKITPYPMKRLKAYYEKLAAETATASPEDIPF